MVHLIHRKQVPLLHNTVFILWDEEEGLVVVRLVKFLFNSILRAVSTFMTFIIPEIIFSVSNRQRVFSTEKNGNVYHHLLRWCFVTEFYLIFVSSSF